MKGGEGEGEGGVRLEGMQLLAFCLGERVESILWVSKMRAFLPHREMLEGRE